MKAWKECSIGIAGAGLMGRLIALLAREKGAHVTLFDSDERSGEQSCGLTAAGMIAPISELEKTEPLLCQIGLQALAQWPALLEKLHAPVHFQQQGTVVVAHSRDHNDLLHFNRTVNHKQTLSESLFQQIDRATLSELEPTLAERFHSASFLPTEGHVSTADLFPALEKTLMALGVDWHHAHVDHVGAGEIKLDDGSSHSFDWCIDCRAMGAKEAMPDLRGVRGEVMLFHAPDVKLTRPVRLMHPRYRLYIVPRPDDIFVIGATEIESYDMSEISVRSSLELLSAVYAVDPRFSEARIITSRVNCRPAFPDNHPIIQYDKGHIQVNGLYRHGYLLGPCVAEEVIAQMSNDTSERLTSAFVRHSL